MLCDAVLADMPLSDVSLSSWLLVSLCSCMLDRRLKLLMCGRRSLHRHSAQWQASDECHHERQSLARVQCTHAVLESKVGRSGQALWVRLLLRNRRHSHCRYSHLLTGMAACLSLSWQRICCCMHVHNVVFVNATPPTRHAWTDAECIRIGLAGAMQNYS